MNTSFSTQNPLLQLAWDSHSLNTFKECPRKYYYSIILGFQPKRTAVDLTFGILYASGKEKYHKARASGMDHDEALRFSVRHTLAMSGTHTENGWSPWRSDDKNKNLVSLIRTLIWNLEEFKQDYLKTYVLPDGTPAVELSFSFTLDHRAYTDEPFILCGHMDRIAVQPDGTKIVCDDKTTRSTISSEWFDRFNPNQQMSQYTFGGQIILSEPVHGVLIDGAQIAVNFSRFVRGMSHRTKAQLEEWYHGALWWIALAEDCARQDYYPLNESSCFLCGFKNVCNKDPSVRPDFLRSDFVKRKWDPLEGRE